MRRLALIVILLLVLSACSMTPGGLVCPKPIPPAELMDRAPRPAPLAPGYYSGGNSTDVDMQDVLAWQIDAAGDLGNKERLLPLVRDFSAAIADIQAIYGSK